MSVSFSTLITTQNRPPFEAAKSGELSKIENFIRNGGWVNTPSCKEKSMLYYAAKKGHLNVIEYLISQGACLYQSGKESLLNKAPEYVKEVLTSLKSVSLPHLIQQKAQTLNPAEILSFIKQLPSKQSFELLDQYLMSLSYSSPEEALLVLNHFPEENQFKLLDKLINSFLSYGNIESASACAARIMDPIQKELKTFQITVAHTLLQQFDESLENSPEKLTQLLREGFTELNKCGVNYSEPMLNELIGLGSLLKINDYTNQLTDPEKKGVIRCTIAHGLQDVATQSLISAKNRLDESYRSLEDSINSLLAIARTDRDFTKLFDILDPVQNPLFKETLLKKVCETLEKLHQI